MAANRIKGVRAAVFYNGPSEIVKLSREHNNANILSLGARFMTEDEIYTILEMWFSEPFGGGRHQKRCSAQQMRLCWHLLQPTQASTIQSLLRGESLWL